MAKHRRVKQGGANEGPHGIRTVHRSPALVAVGFAAAALIVLWPIGNGILRIGLDLRGILALVVLIGAFSFWNQWSANRGAGIWGGRSSPELAALVPAVFTTAMMAILLLVVAHARYDRFGLAHAAIALVAGMFVYLLDREMAHLRRGEVRFPLQSVRADTFAWTIAVVIIATTALRVALDRTLWVRRQLLLLGLLYLVLIVAADLVSWILRRRRAAMAAARGA